MSEGRKDKILKKKIFKNTGGIMVNLVALSELNAISKCLKMLVGEVCKNISKISTLSSSFRVFGGL